MWISARVTFTITAKACADASITKDVVLMVSPASAP
jgi:hypothetical protein